MKPEKVRKAQLQGDQEALSQMGKAGGHRCAQIRARDRQRRALLIQLDEVIIEKEEEERAESTNENDVPVV